MKKDPHEKRGNQAMNERISRKKQRRNMKKETTKFKKRMRV